MTAGQTNYVPPPLSQKLTTNLLIIFLEHDEESQYQTSSSIWRGHLVLALLEQDEAEAETKSPSPTIKSKIVQKA